MKLLLTLTLFLTLTTTIFAEKLLLINLNSPSEKQVYFNNPSLKIHFQNDVFMIASGNMKLKPGMVLLDETAWEKNANYSIVYANIQEKQRYINNVPEFATVCHKQHNYLIIKHTKQIEAAKNDGMIRILPYEIKQNNRTAHFPKYTVGTRSETFIDTLMSQVADSNLSNTIHHLEDYGTRIYNTPEAALAETWIKEKYEALGLDVIVQDFPQTGSSDNVIATQTGTKYPNEYIVCGAHYDSYNNAGGAAPGADDNASGNSGIIEIARILSQHEFDRTIIYCAWSAEEIGLIGSGYYAKEAAAENMNILGYFNLDMIGYLKEGTEQHIDMLYADNAEPLAQFFKSICSVYFPGMPVERKFFAYGDSDHTSFNNNGYMGIFPFEDVDNYSPYIHTPEDLLGTSVNNIEMATVYTKATLASIATMANMLMPPQNLKAQTGDQLATLHWDAMQNITQYNLYRDSILLTEIDANANSYVDSNLVNEQNYTYYITCIYSESEEESVASNSVNVTPTPPLTLPYFNDFENGFPEWTTDGLWGITTKESNSPTQCIDDSPYGFYAPATNSTFNLKWFPLSDTTESISAHFYMKYDLEMDYDFAYFEIYTDDQWITLDTYNGNKAEWTAFSYSLNDYIGQAFIALRFRIESDNMIEKEGLFIDDFGIGIQAVLEHETPQNLTIEQEANLYPQINWEAPTNETPNGYKLYRNDELILTCDSNTLVHIDSNIVHPMEFCYNATAIYGDEESEYSNSDCFTPIFTLVDNYSTRNVVISPNPAKNIITIKATNMNQVSIFSMGAKLVKQYETNGNSKTIDVSEFDNGIYLVKVKTASTTFNERIVIE